VYDRGRAHELVDTRLPASLQLRDLRLGRIDGATQATRHGAAYVAHRAQTSSLVRDGRRTREKVRLVCAQAFCVKRQGMRE
jgi:hypothetical protein